MREDVTSPPKNLKFATQIRGRIRVSDEDFEVEELPLYPTSGTGEHLYLLFEKRDMTTPGLVAELARSLRCHERDIGYAGYKDRHAVTRQWLSVPRRFEASVEKLALSKARLLDQRAHENKLRLGHLRGNRFTITVQDVSQEDFERAQTTMQQLEKNGCPNGFGRQRFGARKDNHRLGASLIQKDAEAFFDQITHSVDAVESPRIADGRRLLRERKFAEAALTFPHAFVVERHIALAMKKIDDLPHAVSSLPRRSLDFLISAWQSACFNAALEARISVGLELDLGDIAMKVENGACFAVTDLATDGPRAKCGEILPTGPMPGEKMLVPTGRPGTLEEAAVKDLGCPWPPASLDAARGERRALLMPVKETNLSWDNQRLRLSFALPRGSFATAVLAHLGLDEDPEGG